MMVFTREISSRMKSSLFMLRCLLLFTCFCRDEISSQDELILVKKTGMKFHPELKGKKDVLKLIMGWNFTMSMFLLNF